MNKNELKKYAEVVIEAGINLYKGQCLNISTGLENYDFAILLAEAAYEKGAKYVEINANSNRLTKTRIEKSNDEDLKHVPHYTVTKSYEMLSHDWANIRIDNTEELDTLKDINTTRLDTMFKARQKALTRQKEEYMNHKHQWCVICAPGPKWANKVLGTDDTENNIDRLWEKLKPILRLDKDEPVKAWKEHGEKLIELSKKMGSLNLDKVILKGPGTELELGLNRTSIWIGGPTKKPDGRMFIPNIPTEEIFTTPDYRRTNGKVKTTRPVKVMENIVEGAWFEFKDGKVVDFGADVGKDILEKFINVDKGSSYIGELALVDAKTPIYQSGLMFNSILYDENATCHIALGAAYPSCLSNGSQLISERDKLDAGCNVSLVHTDFMVGSNEVDVIGVDVNGKEIDIMKKGSFVI